MKTCINCNVSKSETEFSKNRNQCKECRRNYRKSWRDDNKDKIKEYNNKNYNSNKEERKVLDAQYYLDNKEVIRERQKKYHKEKIASDPLYKLKYKSRKIISKSLKKEGYSKNSQTQEILGCSFEELKIHLESQFETWMSWDNYGRYNGELNFGWDIDHINPLCSATSEEEILKLNHYTNLQPLCSKVNRDIKRGNL